MGGGGGGGCFGGVSISIFPELLKNVDSDDKDLCADAKTAGSCDLEIDSDDETLAASSETGGSRSNDIETDITFNRSLIISFN